MKVQPFHLAIPVYDLEACRKFYGEVLGCGEGRSSDHWVDFNFFGHQLVIHYKPKENIASEHINPVDGKSVPVPHFGVVLEWNVFEQFSSLLEAKNINFIIPPYIRFEGEVGEQATMFFKDPCGNALEFKAFRNKDQIFAT
ncbi:MULTISPECIES: VOC family protein [unclassified Zunongwangia]|uniref:VOC family protein n=1 Tax=unclassified Zunongwangia TaxID=2632541 RepID=UPI0022DDC87E|nr:MULTISPECIES: VOC family protein [unclassified Zunongwangia]WBL21823.1 glyoxalase [Zunongwangia sp. HRR-M8]WBL26229.1 glyoxalase [Zunongwangia sp. HGR-M22]